MPRPIRDHNTARSDLAALYADLVERAREHIARSESHRPLEPEVYPVEVLQRPDRECIAAADAGQPIAIYAFQLPRDHRAGRDDHKYMLTPDGRIEPMKDATEGVSHGRA